MRTRIFHFPPSQSTFYTSTYSIIVPLSRSIYISLSFFFWEFFPFCHAVCTRVFPVVSLNTARHAHRDRAGERERKKRFKYVEKRWRRARTYQSQNEQMNERKFYGYISLMKVICLYISYVPYVSVKDVCVCA